MPYLLCPCAGELASFSPNVDTIGEETAHADQEKTCCRESKHSSRWRCYDHTCRRDEREACTTIRIQGTLMFVIFSPDWLAAQAGKCGCTPFTIKTSQLGHTADIVERPLRGTGQHLGGIVVGQMTPAGTEVEPISILVSRPATGLEIRAMVLARQGRDRFCGRESHSLRNGGEWMSDGFGRD